MRVHKLVVLAAMGFTLGLGTHESPAQADKPPGPEKLRAVRPAAPVDDQKAPPGPLASKPLSAKTKPAAAKPVNSEPPKTAAEYGQRFLANKTIYHHSPQHGTQIEYHTADGRAFLWYPGNPIILAGQWRAEEVPNAPKLWEEPPGSGNIVERRLFQPCYRYGPNTYNPVTRHYGDRWECSFPSLLTGTEQRRDGDLFRLARGGPVPFVMAKRRYTFEELLAGAKANPPAIARPARVEQLRVREESR